MTDHYASGASTVEETANLRYCDACVANALRTREDATQASPLRCANRRYRNLQSAVRFVALFASLLCGISCTDTAGPKIAATSQPAAAMIEPGEVWPDTDGHHIQAHGGGVIQVGETFYWYGEQRGRGLDRSKRYVSCYSSKDLAHWTFQNNVLQQSDPEHFGPRWIIERPKVFYNAKTKSFVMYMHIDGPSATSNAGYALARVGIATCDTADGNYKYIRNFRPLGDESRDIGQFMDDDGTAYLIFEDRPSGGFHIAKLSEDYLDVEKEIAFIHAPLEGGALVHYQGLYYLVASHMSGWDANPNVYATAEKLEGPWSEFKNIAPPEKYTYGAQSAMLLKVTGSKASTVIFIGDIWKPFKQWDARYLWMPVSIGDGKLRLPEPREWSIDVKTGEATINRSAPSMPLPSRIARQRAATTRPGTTQPRTTQPQ